ncbi:MAG: ATP-binding protein [Bacteroidota bacterium]
MLKVLITGPESTGKTRLAQYLARQFQAPWVPEFARAYLSALDRPYEEEDLLRILNGQLRLQGQQDRSPILFCDTGPEVIHIWSQVKFGRVDPYIDRQVREVHYDLRLLCYPDLAWEPDPLREASSLAEREQLFANYQALLDQLQLAYTIVRGQGEEREKAALKEVERLMQLS